MGEVVFIGGSGLLGSEFKKVKPQFLYPTSKELNITDVTKINEYLNRFAIDYIVLAAAQTSPPTVEKNPINAMNVNIIGAANIARYCSEHSVRLIYISTDYVFDGKKGMYKEEDPVFPVNKYAWSKLGGECAVRMLNDYLIIRTSFGPNKFPYDAAFTDQWTSRESVKNIVEMMIKVLDKKICGVVHVGGNRKSVFEYACSLESDKTINKISIAAMKTPVPSDTSLNTDKYKDIVGENE